jgi:hypothetical protein
VPETAATQTQQEEKPGTIQRGQDLQLQDGHGTIAPVLMRRNISLLISEMFNRQKASGIQESEWESQPVIVVPVLVLVLGLENLPGLKIRW